jgi:hypothetical protein
MLTDAEIAGLTFEQRRGLILRLSGSLEPAPSGFMTPWMRSARLIVVVGGSVLLVPWTLYLASSLPGRYVVHGGPDRGAGRRPADRLGGGLGPQRSPRRDGGPDRAAPVVEQHRPRGGAGGGRPAGRRGPGRQGVGGGLRPDRR